MPPGNGAKNRDDNDENEADSKSYHRQAFSRASTEGPSHMASTQHRCHEKQCSHKLGNDFLTQVRWHVRSPRSRLGPILKQGKSRRTFPQRTGGGDAGNRTRVHYFEPQSSTGVSCEDVLLGPVL